MERPAHQNRQHPVLLNEVAPLVGASSLIVEAEQAKRWQAHVLPTVYHYVTNFASHTPSSCTHVHVHAHTIAHAYTVLIDIGIGLQSVTES